jgi:SAM-dependent methyltransferase
MKGMADSISGKLHLWEGWLPRHTAAPAAAPRAAAPSGSDQERAFAARLYAAETMQSGRRSRRETEAEPFTLQWYLEVESGRYGRHGRWVPRLLEFAKHAGEALLGLGNGLGTDWVQYARCGAVVTACSPSEDHLTVIRRNFELRGLPAAYLHANPAALPLPTASIDVACVSNLLDDTADPAAVVEEVYRVLKPGGKVLAVTAARYDVAYWSRCLAPWRKWFRRAPEPSLAGFSRHGLRRLFQRFVEPRVHKRHLRRAETPHLWRWLPLPVLERLVGRRVILKAFKPLSAALAVPLAA